MRMTIRGSQARIALLATMLLPLATAGCMYTPYEGQVFASRSTPIDFSGFVDVPGAPVWVYAQTWNDVEACAGETGYWAALGSARSSQKPVYDGDGKAWYGWKLVATVPLDSWCLGPGPEPGGLGYTTNVMGIYRYYVSQLGEKWRPLYTGYKNSVTCASQEPSKSGFLIISHCSRINEPDWYAAQIWAH